MQATGRILVLGALGQLGSALTKSLGIACNALSRQDLDLTDSAAITRILERYKPSAILNAAAYTQVDKAEQEESLAHKINADAPAQLAKWAAERNVPLIHYSTAAVFSGQGQAPWTEDSPTSPQSAYGRTKLAGEQAITQIGGPHLIIRTTWVYDAHANNFVTSMLRLGKDREALQVADDPIGAPTYATHLARATLEALAAAQKAQHFPSGVYHLCNSGETSLYDFALALFDAARARGLPLKVKTVTPIPPLKAPQNSRLSTDKARQVLGVALPDWQRGLQECLLAR